MKQISSGGIEITDYCNLNCLHCYLGLSQRHKQHMDFARILFIIDEYIKRKAGHITITGGEPFVHPKIHDLIVIIGNNYRDTPFILTTNGTLLTQDAIGPTTGNTEKILLKNYLILSKKWRLSRKNEKYYE